MRTFGVVKIAVVVFLDFIVLNHILGMDAAFILIAGIALYAWLGEYSALWKDKAIHLKDLPDDERLKLIRVHQRLTEDTKRVSGVDISGIKLHVIPSDDLNAYAYGIQNAAVTRSTLHICDDATLCSVLGHEVSHLLNMDAVFHRLIFANVTLATVGIAIGSFISVSFLWLVFILMCAFGICGGVLSMLVFHGVNNIVKSAFTTLQKFVIVAYQLLMGLVSRSCEVRADKYSCQLRYGSQLSYFLNHFVGGQGQEQRSIHQILYASHPDTEKRVMRIKEYALAE